MISTTTASRRADVVKMLPVTPSAEEHHNIEPIYQHAVYAAIAEQQDGGQVLHLFANTMFIPFNNDTSVEQEVKLVGRNLLFLLQDAEAQLPEWGCGGIEETE